MEPSPRRARATAANVRRTGRIAKAIGAHLALQTALMIAVAGTGVCADDMDRAGARSPGVRAKAEYCTDCHGLSGQGYQGYLVMPRLAGQQTEYLENQLRAFAEHTRQRNLAIAMVSRRLPVARSARNRARATLILAHETIGARQHDRRSSVAPERSTL